MKSLVAAFKEREREREPFSEEGEVLVAIHI